MTQEQKKEKVEKLNEIRDERAKSRSVERRLRSAVRLQQKDENIKRVRSRFGADEENRKSSIQLRIQEKEEHHKKAKEELET